MKDNAIPISCFNCEHCSIGLEYTVNGHGRVTMECLKNQRNHTWADCKLIWGHMRLAMEGHASFCPHYETAKEVTNNDTP